MKTQVNISKDRRRPGVLNVMADDGEILAASRCLAKADNIAAAKHDNEERDQLKTFGDTPTGMYRGTVCGPMEPEDSYGAHGVIRLAVVSGSAKASRRAGLLIHGGPLGAAGLLRPTHGCIRVSDEGMARTLGALGSVSEFDVEVVEVS